MYVLDSWFIKDVNRACFAVTIAKDLTIFTVLISSLEKNGYISVSFVK